MAIDSFRHLLGADHGIDRRGGFGINMKHINIVIEDYPDGTKRVRATDLVSSRIIGE